MKQTQANYSRRLLVWRRLCLSQVLGCHMYVFSFTARVWKPWILAAAPNWAFQLGESLVELILQKEGFRQSTRQQSSRRVFETLFFVEKLQISRFAWNVICFVITSPEGYVLENSHVGSHVDREATTVWSSLSYSAQTSGITQTSVYFITWIHEVSDQASRPFLCL